MIIPCPRSALTRFGLARQVWVSRPASARSFFQLSILTYNTNRLNLGEIHNMRIRTLDRVTSDCRTGTVYVCTDMYFKKSQIIRVLVFDAESSTSWVQYSTVQYSSVQ